MYHRNQVFVAACLGMLLFGIVFLSLGSVNNMLAERFKLDDRAIGTLTALLPFGILAGSLIFGSIVDRFGYRWMLVGSSLIVGGSLEGIAAASNQSLVQFFVFAIGFGGGMLNGATNALAADVSEGERGAKLSLLGVFFGIGALTIPSTIAILSHSFSISTIVAAIGALVLVPAAYCLAIEFPPPKMRLGNTYTRPWICLAARSILLAGLSRAGHSKRNGGDVERLDDPIFLQKRDAIRHRSKRKRNTDGPRGIDDRNGGYAVGAVVATKTHQLASGPVRQCRNDSWRLACIGDDFGIQRFVAGCAASRLRTGRHIPGRPRLRWRSIPATFRHGVQHDLRSGFGGQHDRQQIIRPNRA